MLEHRRASTNGRAPSVDADVRALSELDDLQARCRQQAGVIETLGEAIAVLRTGASALKAENADLRAANQRMRLEEINQQRRARIVQAEDEEPKMAFEQQTPCGPIDGFGSGHRMPAKIMRDLFGMQTPDHASGRALNGFARMQDPFHANSFCQG